MGKLRILGSLFLDSLPFLTLCLGWAKERSPREGVGGRMVRRGREVVGRRGGRWRSAYLSVSASFGLPMSLAVCQSLSLSLPFCVILVLGLGDFNPAPLLCPPHSPLTFCPVLGAD